MRTITSIINLKNWVERNYQNLETVTFENNTVDYGVKVTDNNKSIRIMIRIEPFALGLRTPDAFYNLSDYADKEDFIKWLITAELNKFNLSEKIPF